MDGIAARAGVGKQTIYRWWPTKADVILEACAPRSEFAVPVPDLGDFGADLREFLRRAFSMAADERTVDLLRSLMVEAQVRPEFGARFRSGFLEPRRAAFRTIVDRASGRGDFPDHLTPSSVTDVVFGSFWYRLLATDAGPDASLAEELVAMLTRGSGR